MRPNTQTQSVTYMYVLKCRSRELRELRELWILLERCLCVKFGLHQNAVSACSQCIAVTSLVPPNKYIGINTHTGPQVHFKL